MSDWRLKENHIGKVGDAYLITEACKLSCSGSETKLRVGDVVIRRAHAGDGFSNFEVYRFGRHIASQPGYERHHQKSIFLGNIHERPGTFEEHVQSFFHDA